MEMLFAVLGGLFLSLGAHFLVPERTLRGSALLTAIGTAVAAVVWTALTWLGWPFDGGWIWAATLASGPIAALAVGFLITPRRRTADEQLFERLSRS